MISFSAVDPRMSTWSAVVPPPRGMVGDGSCGSYHQALVNPPARQSLWCLTYLDCHHLDPCRVPALTLPALDAHRAEAEEVHGAVALADAHAVEDARELGLVGVLGVDLGAPQEGQVERRAGRGAVGGVGALGVDAVRLDFVVLVPFAGVPGGGERGWMRRTRERSPV